MSSPDNSTGQAVARIGGIAAAGAKMTAHAAGFDLAGGSAAESRDVEARRDPVDPLRVQHGAAAGMKRRCGRGAGLSSRHGITLINSPGTIDADYRGEVQVPLINLGRARFVVERGMRIAQMMIAAVPAVEISRSNRWTKPIEAMVASVIQEVQRKDRVIGD